MTDVFRVRPIGIIRTPFKEREGIPIQASKSNVQGTVEVFPEFSLALDSLDLFSHVILLYWFHNAGKPNAMVRPFLDETERGMFSTRAPRRYNPIGLSTVRLLEIEGNKLIVEGADMVDGTPLIDIKPFVPEFDNRPDATSGWLEGALSDKSQKFLSDERFSE